MATVLKRSVYTRTSASITAPVKPDVKEIADPALQRFLDAVWMERGLSVNTLAAYKADLTALGRWLVTITVVTVVALAVGMKIGGDGIDLLGLYGLGAFVNAAAVLWAAGVALRLRTMQAGPIQAYQDAAAAWDKQYAAPATSAAATKADVTASIE